LRVTFTFLLFRNVLTSMSWNFPWSCSVTLSTPTRLMSHKAPALPAAVAYFSCAGDDGLSIAFVQCVSSVATRTSDVIEQLRARLVELTGNAGCEIVVADSLGVINHVDQLLARSLGWSADELVGRALTTIIPPRFRDAHYLGVSRFLCTGRHTVLERALSMRVMTRKGEEVPAEHMITAMRASEGWTFAAAIRLERS
jgi:PAS domain S-box-containing protein